MYPRRAPSNVKLAGCYLHQQHYNVFQLLRYTSTQTTKHVPPNEWNTQMHFDTLNSKLPFSNYAINSFSPKMSSFRQFYKFENIPPVIDHIKASSGLGKDYSIRVNGNRKLNSNLPSDFQLDEMMNYFQDQAANLFTSFGWTYQKCHPNILFQNTMLRTETRGRKQYIAQINILKAFMHVILSKPELSIVRMTKSQLDGTIHVRWQVQGVPWWLRPFSIFGDQRTWIRYVDGFSIFYVKSDGLYDQHILMKMTPLRNESKESTISSFLAKIGYFGPDLEPSPKSVSNTIK